jgi:hypothetical protein
MEKRCILRGTAKDNGNYTVNKKTSRLLVFIIIFLFIFLISIIGLYPFSPQDLYVLASGTNSSDNSNLTIFLAEYNSTTDNYTENFHPYHWEEHYFVAVYTDTSGIILTNHTNNKCYINFSDTGSYVLMNSNGSLYVYNRTLAAGNYTYTVICNSTDIYNTTKANETFEIFGNKVDVFTKTYYDNIGDQAVSSWADYDNDDDLDFFITGSSTFFYNQDASNVFSKDNGITIQTGEERNIAFVDIDNDEDLDLIINNHNQSGIPTVYSSVIYRNINNNYSEDQVILSNCFR